MDKWATSRENVSSRIFYEVRFKPACSATEASWSVEISNLITRGVVLSRQRTTKVLIRLRGCAGWCWSDCADAQADLRLCCSHMTFDTFLHDMAPSVQRKLSIVSKIHLRFFFVFFFFAIIKLFSSKCTKMHNVYQNRLYFYWGAWISRKCISANTRIVAYGKMKFISYNYTSLCPPPKGRGTYCFWCGSCQR